MLTNLTDEARANLHRMTEIPAEVYIWTGVVILVLWIIAALASRETPEERADRIAREQAARAEALDLAHSGGIPACGSLHYGWTCDRPKGHPGIHTDSTAGRELGSARWVA